MDFTENSTYIHHMSNVSLSINQVTSQVVRILEDWKYASIRPSNTKAIFLRL